MLSCRTDIAQASLQRRSIVNGTGASEPVAGRDHLAAHLVDPGRGLVPAGGLVEVLDTPCNAILPIPIALLFHERARRAQSRFRTPELELHGRRILERNPPI